MSDDLPLKCCIEDGGICIRVGPKTLAFATENHPELLNEQCEPMFEIENAEEWMESIVNTLNKEEEDGSTMVTKMLDAAILYALEHGEFGIRDKEGI